MLTRAVFFEGDAARPITASQPPVRAGAIVTTAATNKCLAQGNKSGTAVKATNERSALRCAGEKNNPKVIGTAKLFFRPSCRGDISPYFQREFCVRETTSSVRS
jgi:hypothetical protein